MPAPSALYATAALRMLERRARTQAGIADMQARMQAIDAHAMHDLAARPIVLDPHTHGTKRSGSGQRVFAFEKA